MTSGNSITETTGAVGPARLISARAGWEKMVETVNGNGGRVEEHPGRWSRRWCEEPPVGTEVLLGGGLVEVHVGRGIWQTISV